MSSKVVRLEEVCSVRRGSSPRPIQNYLSSEGMPWVKISDVTNLNSRYIMKTEQKIKMEGVKKSVVLEPGTLIVSNSGTAGIPMFMGITGCVHDGWLILQELNGIIPDYLYYTIVNSRRALLHNAYDSVMKNLTIDMIRSFEVYLPSLEIQTQVTDVLNALDSKIELNNKMNKNLEQMAQAIFKQWFVDFEFPNEQGEPYKSSGGEMVWCEELGKEIPKGWGIHAAEDLVPVKDGTHDSPKPTEQGFRLITSKHLKENRIDKSNANIISEEDYIHINSRSKVDTYDILISMIGTVGNIHLVQEEVIDFAIKNIGLFKTSTNLLIYEYIYFYLLSEPIKQYINERLAGSTQQYISLGELRKIPIYLPNKDNLGTFKKVANELLNKIHSNIKQNANLINLRDTLLPKLMSGEIDVSNIEL